VGHGDWSDYEAKRWGVDSWFREDVDLITLSSKLAEPPDSIFHCAGGSSVSSSFEDSNTDFEKTVGSTGAVLEYARLMSPDCKITYISSAAVYGRSDILPTPVNTFLRPISPYGFHKKLAEDLCFSAAEFHGLNVSIVRLFSVYGAGLRKQLLWDACKKLCAGDFIFHGTGNETRDWIHIDDAVKLVIASNKFADEGFRIVNGAGGESLKNSDILTLIGKQFYSDFQLKFIGDKHIGNPDHYSADISCANHYGWKPTESLEMRVVEYVDWFKSLGI
jgi:UDP-glucose 4-epimerase